jgi:hypothetical protein
MGLAEAVAQVLERFSSITFNGAPLRVFDDSSLVNPPCVWVPVPGLEFSFHKGTAVATWTAYLVAPNNNTLSVSQTLSALLDAVAGLFPFTEARAQPLNLPGGGPPHPSYAVTWQSRIQIGAL